ncbi:MAG TPA: NAD(P)-dependent oxidoreductase [Acetobacteraceae bacterium]|nr:NAD(P)-dependent oxidoreductase [Acetobacteraceae bacterium]
MKGVFIDASDALGDVYRKVRRPTDPPVTLYEEDHVPPEALPRLLEGHDFVIDDHSQLPTDAMRACRGIRHVIFLGTGARSYMNPEELAEFGIEVHIIKGYGDTAVAEHTIALMWAAARGLARMDRLIRQGEWPRTEGMELTGKTIGLIGFGGIGAEVARIAFGAGMRVLAWNRTKKPAPKATPTVHFVPLDTLLAESDIVSLHLLLTDETRGFLGAERLGKLRPGAILVNTARGALVDEAAMIAALKEGRLAHAALDVFETEPLPMGHPLTTLENVTLSAHSGFRTPEASEKLIRSGLDIACRLAGGG